MRLWDGTQIAKPVVYRGITQWTTMADDLNEEATHLAAQVKAALAAQPWGAGTEGQSFFAAHFRGDGPNRMLKQYEDLAEAITDAGTRVRDNVDNTLLTDADIKNDLQANLTMQV
ncbi:hypothetical protein Nocox_34335 [Nonomuraea coxensis DSM 45129]|uniref:WXG100 family type VII secretion target n=1 Tax=Nonomuraea coxensis DSM 45129 TaxID=1122611 RepID=A0ABX8U9L3_9ACTN|nr:hypothetical protein [Nonomuraea coxensis]QYC44433.1 hypothetical protein Nocox_34335 [Nonomuraea coxensis DSM 45129]